MASTKNENLISNLSYTEKEFQSIYPSLLDLVKKETAKWDPSASNESDPGVLLLKLNAIIADKCNYNIDKNVLECFPVSVTQEKNAWQLFEQLGYYMHWYQAASTAITLKWVGDTPLDDDGEETVIYYTIPRFSMFCDENKEIIYTITDEKDLATTGKLISISAMQGIATKYTINGSDKITTADLDSNNRLYFTERNIAENGIFINNYDSTNFSSWKRKDNLLVEELSTTNMFYKFGVSQDLSTCYIEFPENAEELFQEGINITYIVTDGADGNISTLTLNSIYGTLTATYDNDQSEELTTDDISITNYVAGTGGTDQETINDAYLGYKKVAGTFETLVTLRDYMNAVRNSSYVSNAIVTDRTNDVQTTYKIMSQCGSVSQLVNEQEYTGAYDISGYFDGSDFYNDESQSELYAADEDKNYYAKDGARPEYIGKTYRVIYKTDEYDNDYYEYIEANPVKRPALDAFDLKMYLLSSSSLIKTKANYNKTFTLNTDSSVQDTVEAEINEYKCVQHSIADVLPNKICFIKNKYPINCKIIPQYSLSDTQKADVISNVKTALYENLNSAKISFGDEISFDTVYNIIMDADPLIKAVALDPIEYTSYLVYLKQDSEYDTPEIVETALDQYITYYMKTYLFNTTVSTGLTGIYTVDLNILDFYGNKTGDAEGLEFVKEEDDESSFKVYLVNYQSTTSSEVVEQQLVYENGVWVGASTGVPSPWQKWQLVDNIDEIDTSLKNWIKGNCYSCTWDDSSRILSDDIINQFRIEIYAKSVLAGITQFFIKDTEFDYGINQRYQLLERNIGRLDTNLKVTLNSENDWSYNIRENEVIQIYAPNLIQYASYGGNCRFEYFLKHIVAANESYMLQSGEFMIMYYMESSDSSGYTYAVFSEGAIIKPSFRLNNSALAVKYLVGAELCDSSFHKTVTIGSQTYMYWTGNTLTENVSSSLNKRVAAMSSSGQLLSDDKTVEILTQNSISIDSSKYSCYWVVNEEVNGRYILFNKEIGTERILKSGEYFIYTDPTYADFVQLGAGTYITRKSTSQEDDFEMSCEAIDYSDIIDNGANALADKWVTVDSSIGLKVVEMQYTALGDGVITKIQPNTPTLREIVTYESNIRYEYKISTTVTPETHYTLKDDEFIIFYSQLDDVPTDYAYYVYGKGTTLYSEVYLQATTSTLVGAALTTDEKCYDNSLYTIETSHPGLTLTDNLYKYGKGATSEISGLTDAVTSGVTTLLSSEITTEALDSPSISQIDLTSTAAVNLYYCDINYKTSITDETWTSVPKINLVNTNFSWRALSLLRLNLTTSLPQELLSGQNVVYYYYDSDNAWIVTSDKEEYYTESEWEEIKPGTIDPDEEPFNDVTYLLTSKIINDIGPKITVLDYTDDASNPTTISIYAYVLGQKSTNIKFLDDGTTQIVFKGFDGQITGETKKREKKLTFKLPKGNYIMPVSHDTNEGILNNVGIWLSYPDSTSSSGTTTRQLASMSDDSIKNFKLAGNYYLKINDLPDTDDSTGQAAFFVTLTFRIEYKLDYPDEDSVPTVTLIIPPIFKYTDSESLSDNDDLNATLFMLIYEKIKELDKNNLFDYTHVVDDDIKIDSPLDSKSFLDVNHVMNPFTICQMNEDSSKFNIQVTNVVKGS